jgi:glycosyltransferase involved in cell wall biosynthesis
MSNKLLIITYYWPPGSGAGVQRWLKFSKYLPSFGWTPVILTVEPRDATYPAFDNSLEAEISSGLKVFKTRATDYFRFYNKDKSKIPSAGFASNDDKRLKGKILRFIRGNFFIPDPRKGWNKYAFAKACQIIEDEGIKHIITTSPPHSTQLIGLKLKRKYTEIKWLTDLRDPWTNIYYYDQFYPTFISRMIDRKYEDKVLNSADKIITVGKSLKEHFATKIRGNKNKIEIITNGFDEEDFEGLIPVSYAKLTISYIGTLSDVYPIKGFLDSLCKLREKGTDFNLKFIGTISPNQKETILSKIDESSVEIVPYVNHKEAIRYMLNTNLLLLIIPDHQSNKSIITGKIFEYIASGKPVLCVGPVDGDAAEIIKSSDSGSTFDYKDTLEMEDFIFRISQNNFQPDKSKISKYSRKELTRKIVELLEA